MTILKEIYEAAIGSKRMVIFENFGSNCGSCQSPIRFGIFLGGFAKTFSLLRRIYTGEIFLMRICVRSVKQVVSPRVIFSGLVKELAACRAVLDFLARNWMFISITFLIFCGAC